MAIVSYAVKVCQLLDPFYLPAGKTTAIVEIILQEVKPGNKVLLLCSLMLCYAAAQLLQTDWPLPTFLCHAVGLLLHLCRADHPAYIAMTVVSTPIFFVFLASILTPFTADGATRSHCRCHM